MLRPQKFRKRPVVIEAMYLCLDNISNVLDWVGTHNELDANEQPYEVKNLSLFPSPRLWVSASQTWVDVEIDNEVIARDRLGFYPIKKALFEETYDPEEDDQ